MSTPKSFLSPARLAGWGVALAVIIGVVVMMKMRAAQESNPSSIPREPAKADLVRYLGKTAATWPAWSAKDAASVPASMGRWVGSQMALEQLFAAESGLTFVGASEGAVPGPGKSAVLGFKAGETPVTIFVQQYLELPKLERGVTYRMPTASGQQVVVGLPEAKLFFIASPKAEGVAAATKALGMPAASKDY
ncbi:MAG: hypothetical protein ACKVW3_05955 [Phycisphaerales bacterium]